MIIIISSSISSSSSSSSSSTPGYRYKIPVFSGPAPGKS